MQYKELEKIKIDDLEKLIRLADDVLCQLLCNFDIYDEAGMSYYRKCQEVYGDNKGYEEAIKLIREQKNAKEFEEFYHFLVFILKEKVDLNAALADTAEELLERLRPLKNRIIGIFRHGSEQDSVTNETEYCVDESISDEYLHNLFAMRVRDRRILLAAQRFPEKYYLLLRGFPTIPDGDELLGIYNDLSILKKAYDKALEELEQEKRWINGARA